MSQTLTGQIDAVAKFGMLRADIPDDVTGNLAPQIELRPYQRAALERWLFYIDKYEGRPKAPHLLFHMATGSGKTVLMAALILDLYRRGYRNFLFFVNSAQIIEKTKENFINPASAKHLFAPTVRIEDKPVDIRAVDTFDAAAEPAGYVAGRAADAAADVEHPVVRFEVETHQEFLGRLQATPVQVIEGRDVVDTQVVNVITGLGKRSQDGVHDATPLPVIDNLFAVAHDAPPSAAP